MNQKEYQLIYRQTHKKERSDYMKEWGRRHRDKIKGYNRKKYIRQQHTLGKHVKPQEGEIIENNPAGKPSNKKEKRDYMREWDRRNKDKRKGYNRKRYIGERHLLGKYVKPWAGETIENNPAKKPVKRVRAKKPSTIQERIKEFRRSRGLDD